MVRIRTVLHILTYCIALLGFSPLFSYLEPAAKMLFPVAFVAGLAADRRGRYLPAPVTTAASLIFFGYYALQLNRDNPVAPAANLIIILLAVRLFSEKSGRNCLQIFVLSLFALAASSLYNLSAVFLVYLVPLLILLSVSLVILAFYAKDSTMVISRPGLNKVLTVALVMPAATIPLMLVFFIILPRTQYPLWNFLNMPGSRITGFSETVQPGASASVGEVKTVAFRVESERLPINRLYWRGIVLNSLDGDIWVRKAPPAGESTYLENGPVISQTIYPEPGRSRYLIALNIPRQISGLRISSSEDHVFTSLSEARQRIKYEAVSVLSETIATSKGIAREFYLRVPGRVSARMLETARDLLLRGKSDEEKLALLEDFYIKNRFSYTTIGLPIGPDSLDAFLFETHRGHCELFATSAATMLRLAGVPTRLVGGYLGGVYNTMGGYYTVTEDMAHVWLEAYVSDRGWVMVDPSKWGVNFAAAGAAGEKGMIKRFRMYLDAFGYYWNRAVITYDLEKQIQLVSTANHKLRLFRVTPGFITWAFALVTAITLLPAAYILIRRGRRSREEKIVEQFLKLVRKRYRLAKVGSTTGLYELAREIDDPRVHSFVSLYGGAVYHDRRLTPAEFKELRQILKALKKR